MLILNPKNCLTLISVFSSKTFMIFKKNKYFQIKISLQMDDPQTLHHRANQVKFKTISRLSAIT